MDTVAEDCTPAYSVEPEFTWKDTLDDGMQKFKKVIPEVQEEDKEALK